MSARKFHIFTADQALHEIEAPSLRTALRNFDDSKSPIIAAVDAECLPAPRSDNRPLWPCSCVIPGSLRSPMKSEKKEWVVVNGHEWQTVLASSALDALKKGFSGNGLDSFTAVVDASIFAVPERANQTAYCGFLGALYSGPTEAFLQNL